MRLCGRRGQIFSLDFVISMVLVILAIGMAIQYVEVHNYAMKDAEMMRELEWIAIGASDVLVSSTDIVCEVADSSNNVLFYLDNCLRQGRITSELSNVADRAKLGIPAGYGCKIDVGATSGTVNINACNDTPSGAENIFSVERTVVLKRIGATILTKSEFDDCVRGSCVELEEAVVTLMVWRSVV